MKKKEKFLEGNVLIIGMGNPLRADDNAGNVVVNKLKNSIKSDKIKFWEVEENIENYIGKIEKSKFDNIILIDAVDFAGKKGEIRLFYPDQLAKISTTTHSLSLSTLLEIHNLKSKSIVIGIQPVNLSFGKEVSKEVKKSIEKLVSIIVNWHNKKGNK